MKMDKDKIKLTAYAKINLALYITGLRADGYHLLDSVFVPVGIYDEVTVKKANSGIKLSCDAGIPLDGRNTAYKAAEILMRNRGIPGADIAIKKNIPSMAGLGGASSDAAAVIIGLNELYHLDMNEKELAETGLEVGADVPFFLGAGAARVRGIGEKISLVMMGAELDLVIIKPDGALSTPEVYKAYDEMRGHHGGSCSRLAEALESGSIAQIAGLIENSLQAAAAKIYPGITEPIGFLEKNGALVASMTGSGSCVFGIFESGEAARDAAAKYAGGGKAYAVKTVGRPVKRAE